MDFLFSKLMVSQTYAIYQYLTYDKSLPHRRDSGTSNASIRCSVLIKPHIVWEDLSHSSASNFASHFRNALASKPYIPSGDTSKGVRWMLLLAGLAIFLFLLLSLSFQSFPEGRGPVRLAVQIRYANINYGIVRLSEMPRINKSPR